MSSKPSRTLLVTPSYVLQNSPINSNVEEKLVAQAIRRAEDIYIMPAIGSQLYQKIISLISGGTMTAGVYKTVLDDYISVALVDYTTLVYIDFNAVKFRNKGMEKQTSDVSTPADSNDLVMMKDSIRTSAQFYTERLIKYLRANIQSYPEYSQYMITIDDMAPARSEYFSGLQFPKSNRGCCGDLGMGFTYDINL